MNKLIGIIAKEIAVGVGINVLATKVIPKLADKAREKINGWRNEGASEKSDASDVDPEDVISVKKERSDGPKKEVYVYNAQWK